ncbi:MAG: hypothetical protein BMS9Abin25_1360 [Gammaproteobacteria bacterium]|nr:MAG: hypothetical protein BMS9Abin25_1360 [Gammaproteobacteria bacterium]
MKQLEIILLGLLVFVLPSLETPKIIFWAFYILTFLVRRYLEHGFSFNKQNAITLSAITLFLVSLISTFVNWPTSKSLSGAFYTLSYVSLFLCLYHGGYTGKQIKTVALVIVLGSLVGLLFGLIEFSSGVTDSMTFHSAGVTTQSSIYLGLVIITAFSLLVDDNERPFLITLFLFLSLFLMGIAILYMGSRGAIFAIFISLVVFLFLNHSRRIIVISSSLIVATTVTAFILISAYPTNMNEPDKRERFSAERLQISDNERLKNWQIAIRKLSTGKDLVWGIGPKNYSTIDPRELGIELDSYQRTGKLNHAHNLFLTQWIEQGLVGLLAMLTFFILVFVRLIKKWPYCRETSRQWVWLAGLGGLVIPVIAGFFNTPFYQEHAMLAMILIGAMYAETKRTA